MPDWLPRGLKCRQNQSRDAPGCFITRGREVERGSWPWMARLEMFLTKNRRFGLCGGTRIDQRTVITAAHCLTQSTVRPSPVRPGTLKMFWLFTTDLYKTKSLESYTIVTLGDHHLTDADPREIAIKSTQFFIHPDFGFTADGAPVNDVAVLKLDRATCLIDEIDFACLAPPAYPLKGGDKCWSASG